MAWTRQVINNKQMDVSETKKPHEGVINTQIEKQQAPWATDNMKKVPRPNWASLHKNRVERANGSRWEPMRIKACETDQNLCVTAENPQAINESPPSRSMATSRSRVEMSWDASR